MPAIKTHHRRIALGLTLMMISAAPGPILAQGKDPPDAALGEYLSAECVACHQRSGQVVGGIPAIIAWPEDQFIAVMSAYKTKDRPHPIMEAIAAKLSDDDIAALAAFFASLKPK